MPPPRPDRRPRSLHDELEAARLLTGVEPATMVAPKVRPKADTPHTVRLKPDTTYARMPDPTSDEAPALTPLVLAPLHVAPLDAVVPIQIDELQVSSIEVRPLDDGQNQ